MQQNCLTAFVLSLVLCFVVGYDYCNLGDFCQHHPHVSCEANFPIEREYLLLPHTGKYKKLVLALHNQFRDLVACGYYENLLNASYPKAKNMKPFDWHLELAYISGDLAKTCDPKLGRDFCYYSRVHGNVGILSKYWDEYHDQEHPRFPFPHIKDAIVNWTRDSPEMEINKGKHIEENSWLKTITGGSNFYNLLGTRDIVGPYLGCSFILCPSVEFRDQYHAIFVCLYSQTFYGIKENVYEVGDAAAFCPADTSYQCLCKRDAG